MGMKSTEEKVALQAIEFWSTVCEEETELMLEAAEASLLVSLQPFTCSQNSQAAEYNEAPEHESRFFAKIALPEITPVLLTLLTQQDEDADEDEWNVSMAAGTCLALLASAAGDNLVPAVIPFIEANIRSTDWHAREAAVMAFGSLLDGPDPSVLAPLVDQALPLLIGMMTDADTHVKDTTAWTLGRVCDLLIGAIKPDVHLHPLVSALVTGLGDSPRIAANACWALMNLADQLGSYYDDESAPTQSGPLSPYYQGTVEALLKITETCVIGIVLEQDRR
jgi:importin subunit beta-1